MTLPPLEGIQPTRCSAYDLCGPLGIRGTVGANRKHEDQPPPPKTGEAYVFASLFMELCAKTGQLVLCIESINPWFEGAPSTIVGCNIAEQIEDLAEDVAATGEERREREAEHLAALFDEMAAKLRSATARSRARR